MKPLVFFRAARFWTKKSQHLGLPSRFENERLKKYGAVLRYKFGRRQNRHRQSSQRKARATYRPQCRMVIEAQGKNAAAGIKVQTSFAIPARGSHRVVLTTCPSPGQSTNITDGGVWDNFQYLRANETDSRLRGQPRSPRPHIPRRC